MKIYASRLDYNSMTDEEIYDYIAGKDLWVLAYEEHEPEIPCYIQIVENLGRLDCYYYKLFYRYNNVQPIAYVRKEFMFPIVRPVQIITSAEVPELTEYHGLDWL